jgi:hypothetical protein
MVVFAAPLPIFRAPAFRCAHTYNSTNPICKDGTENSRDELESLRSPVIEAFKTVENAVTGVQTWDPFSIVCPSRTCSAFNQDGRPLFFDADHLSGYGNRLLAPSFAAFVNPPGRGKRSGEDMFVPVAR